MKIECTGGAVCILTLVAWLTASAQSVPQLTLEQAARLALQHNPILRAKEREYEATRANEITAGLRPNPTASYGAEQLGNRAVEPQHTVALSQTIEMGGKRQRRMESAQAATRVSAFEVADVRRQVVAAVKKAFTDVLVAQATGGGLSVLDLLDAQRTYRETALEHVRALGSYWSLVYQLEAAVGGHLEP